MIEKLSEYKITSRDGSFINVECNTKIINTLIQKINELVDAVNEIMTWRFETDEDSDWYDDPKHREQPAENVQVDEIEQAEKWIGKLCWFSQIYECHQHIAILKRISESGLYVTDDGELHYAYCEPVKPDDDIIYKGDK